MSRVSRIPTVLGCVAPEDLGPTLMHEHLFVLSPEYVRDYGVGAWWDEEERVEDAARELRELAARGIRTLVDQTVQGIGRDIRLIRRVAERVPELNIVVTTGLYTFDAVPQHYAFRGPGLLLDQPDPMIADFTKDITDQIADSGVRAALLKCCVEAPGLVPGVERVAARWRPCTGRPGRRSACTPTAAAGPGCRPWTCSRRSRWTCAGC